MKKIISIVLPCLNEENNIPLLISQIIHHIPIKYAYEIIVVDDGSTDNSKLILQKLAQKNKNIKCIFLYKRSGHQKVLQIGISFSKGDAIIMMDSDFQHPPELIQKFIEKWEQGYDLVNGKKIDNRNISIFRRIQDKLGYYIWSKISSGVITPGVSDFRLISKEIAEFINSSKEDSIFIRGMVNLASKNTTYVTYKAEKRRYGKSSYSFSDLIELFINGFISFSPKPLRVAFVVGIITFTIAGLFLAIDLTYALIIKKKIIEGWLTLVYLTFLVNSMLLIYLGVLGEYVGVIFREVKKRPSYIIDKTINI